MSQRYPTLDALLSERAVARRERAAQRSIVVIAALAGRGIEARVIGSLARGDFKSHSDADFLILSCPREQKYRIESVVEDLMEDIPFHVVYLEEVSAARRPALLDEAIHASDLRRPAE